MNEIEKMINCGVFEIEETEEMYENVGISPKKCSECDNNMDCGYGEGCYPPLTAEKQLKLLCFIVNNRYRALFQNRLFTEGTLTLKILQRDLAWAINRFYQEGLTDEENQQIREILECQK